jgi:hypothetical protein
MEPGDLGTIATQEKDRIEKRTDNSILKYKLNLMEGNYNFCRGPFRERGRDMQNFMQKSRALPKISEISIKTGYFLSPFSSIYQNRNVPVLFEKITGYQQPRPAFERTPTTPISL